MRVLCRRRSICDIIYAGRCRARLVGRKFGRGRIGNIYKRRSGVCNRVNSNKQCNILYYHTFRHAFCNICANELWQPDFKFNGFANASNTDIYSKPAGLLSKRWSDLLDKITRISAGRRDAFIHARQGRIADARFH